MVVFVRRAGMNLLATLPLWLSLGGVLFLSRDFSETASMAFAAAVLITFTGTMVVSVVIHRAWQVTKEHDTVVLQTLALVDCMKDLNQRVRAIESANGLDPAPLNMIDSMAIPPAHNDARIHSAKSQIGSFLLPSLVTDCPITSFRPDHKPGLIIAPKSLSPAAITSTVSMAKQKLAAGTRVEIVVHTKALSEILVPLATHFKLHPLQAEMCLIGISQTDLTSEDANVAMAVLGCSGAKLSVRNVENLEFSPKALRECGISRLSCDCGWLLKQIAARPRPLMAWIADLERNNIELIGENATEPEMRATLKALGVAGCTMQPNDIALLSVA